jgi:hypothetical protein
MDRSNYRFLRLLGEISGGVGGLSGRSIIRMLSESLRYIFGCKGR